jgi:hypothetical protein
MAKKTKLGRKPKYNEKTMVSSIRHPKSKKKEVKAYLKTITDKFELEFKRELF